MSEEKILLTVEVSGLKVQAEYAVVPGEGNVAAALTELTEFPQHIDDANGKIFANLRQVKTL